VRWRTAGRRGEGKIGGGRSECDAKKAVMGEMQRARGSRSRSRSCVAPGQGQGRYVCV
jgi:hypothetical protein